MCILSDVDYFEPFSTLVHEYHTNNVYSDLKMVQISKLMWLSDYDKIREIKLILKVEE